MTNFFHAAAAFMWSTNFDQPEVDLVQNEVHVRYVATRFKVTQGIIDGEPFGPATNVVQVVTNFQRYVLAPAPEKPERIPVPQYTNSPPVPPMPPLPRGVIRRVPPQVK